MGCKNCTDPDGVSCYPVFSLAPHKHTFDDKGKIIFGGTVFAPKDSWPKNFSPDPEDDTMGTYTHCLKCGK